MSKTLIVIISIVGALVLVGGSMAISSSVTHNWLATLQWDDPSLANIPDGAYTVEYQHQLPPGMPAMVYGVKMVVQVVGHEYNGFMILQPEQYKSAFDKVIKTVLNQQTLKPDGLSGATVTNTAFLIATSKAINRVNSTRFEIPTSARADLEPMPEPSPSADPSPSPTE